MKTFGTTAVLSTGAVLPSQCGPIVADAVLAAGADLGVFVSVIATVGPGLELETAFRDGLSRDLSSHGTPIWTTGGYEFVGSNVPLARGLASASPERVTQNTRPPRRFRLCSVPMCH